MKRTTKQGLTDLKESGQLFKEMLKNGSLLVEIYKPDKQDLQNPHEQDELYVIISGSGDFILEDEKFDFQIGDLFFVPAGKEHRFENFTDDFSTWVIFYGPIGGESNLAL